MTQLEFARRAAEVHFEAQQAVARALPYPERLVGLALLGLSQWFDKGFRLVGGVSMPEADSDRKGRSVVTWAILLVVGGILVSFAFSEGGGQVARAIDDATRPTVNLPASETAGRPAAKSTEDLKAQAGCQDGRIVVINGETDHWTDVKIEVNGVYSHTADGIMAGTTMRFFPSIFTKGDGTRLSLDAVACKTIDIHATRAGKRAHWNGSY